MEGVRSRGGGGADDAALSAIVVEVVVLGAQRPKIWRGETVLTKELTHLYHVPVRATIISFSRASGCVGNLPKQPGRKQTKNHDDVV